MFSEIRPWSRDNARSRGFSAAGYTAALAAPVLITYAVAWLNLPPFVFEHVTLLLVLAIAVPWGLGPAGLAAVASVVSDNVLLREPIGRSAVTGYRDVLDLALFVTVAVVVSWLVRGAHTARIVAQEAANRERAAREERDRLIATITHDLATPLSVLSGTVQFARQHGGAPGVDLSRLLVRLETACARATSLVKMLSDSQGLESSRFDLELGTHDLRALVEPIVEMMDRYSERHPIVMATPVDSVIVRADADRLQRVVENLINNAIKYSPDGGAVEVSVAAENRQAVLRVRDHGIGISAQAMPHIFERAYRAPEAVRHAPGLGLGLSIAAQVVAKHGGAIEAAAADGRGTIVAVRLPLALSNDHGSHGRSGPERRGAV